MRNQSLSLLLLLASLLALPLALPAYGQTVEVQNGATLQVQNGAVFGLEGGQMNLGPAGATATLDEQGAGRVAGGTLTATRSLNSPSSANPAGLGAIISASVDLGDVTLTRGHTAQSGGGNTSIERYVDISPSKNNSGLNADLTLEYRDDELNGLSESNLEFFKSTDGGSSWTEEGISSQDQTAGRATLSGISSFSRWTLGSSSSPLPVELASFTGGAIEQGEEASGPGRGAVRLTWQTASETGNAGFEIQRKAEEGTVSSRGSWEEVGYRESKANGGTTTEALTYRVTDESVPYSADSVSYRLRQVDTDGSTTLSEPITVGRSGPRALQLLGTAPNPARQRVAVRYGIPQAAAQEAGEVHLRLYDVLGRRVRSVETTAEAGRYKQRLGVSGLASGVYLLRLTAGGQAVTRKLTVVQ